MHLLNWTNVNDILVVDPETDPFFSFHASNNTTCISVSTTSPNTSPISSSSDRMTHLLWQLHLTRFTVQKVITPALVGFGVIGNLVNIAVLTRRWMKSSTNCYLTALAVFDVLYLILAYILSLTHFESIQTSDWFTRFRLPLVRPLTDTCSNTGIWLTLTFTVERYIGVCHPMKGKVWCTPRRAKVIVIVVCIAAALITFPEFFEYTTYSSSFSSSFSSSSSSFSSSSSSTASGEEESVETESRLIVNQTDFGRSAGYSVGYKYVNQALFTFLPLILLSIFNALLLNAVITAARWRQGLAAVSAAAPDKHGPPTETNTTCPGTGTTTTATATATSSSSSSSHRANQSQQRITVMLITVVIVFLVCQTPQAVQHVLVVYLNLRSEMTEEKRLLLTITANVFNLLVIANCCSNFILYSSFSSKFRMTFHRLFLAPCTTRRKRSSFDHLYSEAGPPAPGAAPGAASSLPLNPGHPGREGRRNGHLATVVCTDLWPTDVTNGQTSAANRVSTRVVKQLASEMVELGAEATEGSDDVTMTTSENSPRLTTDHISTPTFL